MLAKNIKTKQPRKLNLNKQTNIIEFITHISENYTPTYYSLIPEQSGYWRKYFRDQFGKKLGIQKADELVDDINAYLKNLTSEDLNEYLKGYDSDVVQTVQRKINAELRNMHRLMDDINVFCPCVKTVEKSDTSRLGLYIEYNFNETMFDERFNNVQNAPLLYVFFKSLFVRRISLTEIMEDVVVLTKRQTCKDPKKLYRATKRAAIELIRSIVSATHLVDFYKDNGEYYIGKFEI